MIKVIFGAQGIALTAYQALAALGTEPLPVCFVVSSLTGNARVLGGAPVYELADYVAGLTDEDKASTEVLIATSESVMAEIEKSLDAVGLTFHMRLDSLRWNELVERGYIAAGTFRSLKSLTVGYNRAWLNIFMAKFYKDKKLSQAYQLPAWITPVQVGAALCEERVADCLDCVGENISSKNVNYSELTALYWLWKHKLVCNGGDGAEYYGLSHYRRILDLTDDDVLRLQDNDVDVVLPYPMMYEPNIEAHHKRYLQDVDWQALLRAVKELQPEYYVRLPEVLGQQYMVNYNIMLAKKQVLRDYCAWLFPILALTEEYSEPKGCERKDRYIGYMGESLATVYFMLNKDRLNIVYTGCRFLV